MIALGRLALSVVIVVAMLAGTGGSTNFPRLGLAIGVSYFALSLGVLALTWSSWWREQKLKLASHLLDIGFFLALLLATGPDVTTPFFPFYLFLVLSAATKWRWRAAVLTGMVVAIAFAAMALAQIDGMAMAAHDQVQAIVRAGHLMVLTLLIAWFGANRPGAMRNVELLFSTRDSVDVPVREALDHMRECLEADTVALIWWEAEEPWHHLAVQGADGEQRIERFGPGEFDWVVAKTLDGQSFLFDAEARRALAMIGHRLRALAGIDAVNPLLARRAGLKAGLVTPLTAEHVEGYFIVGDIEGLSWDDVPLARRVAIDISRGFDLSALLRASLDAAETRTRLGVARDLHDSIAQILAGIGLKLRAAQMRETAEQRDEELHAIEAELVAHQRDIYVLIDNLRHPAGDSLRVDLEAKLEELAAWLRQQWGIAVCFSADHLTMVPRGLEIEISHLFREATANAVRHGGATQVSLSAEVDGDQLVLRCADNGGGFPEHGQFGLDELKSKGFGPRSIIERLDNLGGKVELSSGADGSVLTMTISGALDPQ